MDDTWNQTQSIQSKRQSMIWLSQIKIPGHINKIYECDRQFEDHHQKYSQLIHSHIRHHTLNNAITKIIILHFISSKSLRWRTVIIKKNHWTQGNTMTQTWGLWPDDVTVHFHDNSDVFAERKKSICFVWEPSVYFCGRKLGNVRHCVRPLLSGHFTHFLRPTVVTTSLTFSLLWHLV